MSCDPTSLQKELGAGCGAGVLGKMPQKREQEQQAKDGTTVLLKIKKIHTNCKNIHRGF